MIGGSLDRRVVVVGGGTAGAATALALGRLGVPTVVVERAATPGWKIGEGLPPAASSLLRRLGVRDRVQADRHLPSYGNASAWGSSGLVDQSFIFDPEGAGWHLDRPRFDAMLLEAAREHGARLVVGAASVADRQEGPGAPRLRVTLADGEEQQVQPSFVVDATGRAATLALRQAARRRQFDRLVGVVTLLATRDPAGDRDSRTVVEAVEHGWWYSAPIPDGRLVVAFMSDGDIVRRLAAHRLDGWSSLLGETVHTVTRVVRHECRLLVPPRVVPANGSRLDVVAGSGWLAVGDAALAHDPLSSQGIASALLLGLEAAQAIHTWLQGRPDALDGYRALVDRLDAEYQDGLSYFYRQEQRWPDAPFWARRAARVYTKHMPRTQTVPAT